MSGESGTGGSECRTGAPDERRDPSIQAVAETLRRHPEIRLALLFGSRARGTATPTSDIDLAVNAPGADLLTLAAALSRATGQEIDVVSIDDAGVPLLARIVREGILVHEDRPGRAATWRAHALADLETDLPWFKRMSDAWLARVAAHGI